MQIEPAVLIAFIGSILGLMGLFIRAIMAGDLHPRSVVPREDYEKRGAIADSYAEKFGEQTDAIRALTAVVQDIAQQQRGRVPLNKR